MNYRAFICQDQRKSLSYIYIYIYIMDFSVDIYIYVCVCVWMHTYIPILDCNSKSLKQLSVLPYTYKIFTIHMVWIHIHLQYSSVALVWKLFLPVRVDVWAYVKATYLTSHRVTIWHKTVLCLGPHKNRDIRVRCKNFWFCRHSSFGHLRHQKTNLVLQVGKDLG